MDKDLTPKQQVSEAIRQAESILVITGQHPSVDQAASTIALSAILRKFGKKATAVISDELPAGVKFLPTQTLDKQLDGLRDFIMRVDLSRAEVDKLKYTIEDGKLNVHITPFSGGFSARDVSYDYGDFHFDLVLVLGVAAYSRIDKIYAQNARTLADVPLINIDFHRSNEQYGAINLIEPAAASLSEILIALSESLQTGLVDEGIATAMLTGIIASTDRFTAAHTTPKALTVAAQMMAMGADQQKVIKGLYRDAKAKQSQGRSEKKPEASEPRAIEKPQPISEPAPQPVQSAQPPASPAATAVQPKPAAEPALATETADETPEAVQVPERVMEQLLPPTHIEMSDSLDDLPETPPVHPDQVSLSDDPEPLINDFPQSSKPRNPLEGMPSEPAAGGRVVPRKAANPANNPLLATRLQ